MAHKVSMYVDVIGQWMNINWGFIINWKFSNYNQYGKKNFRAKWWCKSQETFHALQVFHMGITHNEWTQGWAKRRSITGNALGRL